MENWSKYKLGDLATFVNGYAFKPSDWGKEGHPIIRIQNLNDVDAKFNYFAGTVSDKYYVDNGDILISWSASLGVYKWEGDQAVLNQHIFKVVFDKVTIDKDFFIYLIKKELSQIVKNVHGSTMKHITKKRFDNIEVSLPPLQTQQKIVQVLDKAQSLIDKRKEQIELMDELIQSTFYEMFGDPVVNPKGWKKGTIRDLAVKTQYGTSKKATERQVGFPMIRMNNITYEGGWDFSSMKYIDLDEVEQSKYLVYKGDLLFNRTNSKELVGKTAVYREETPMAYAGYLIKLIAKPDANNEYISAYLNSKHGKAVLLNMAKSIVGMANINAEELKKIKTLIPPIELQNQFADIVQKIEAQKQLMEQSLVEMENNYNSLMQRAFKGQLDFEEQKNLSAQN